MLKKATTIISLVVFSIFIINSQALASTSAEELIQPPEGKTVEDNIHKYSSLTFEQWREYYKMAQDKDSVMSNGVYQFYTGFYFLKVMNNPDFQKSLIRYIRPMVQKGNFGTALMNAKFLQLIFADVGNPQAATEMENRIKKINRFAARDGVSMDRISQFLSNMTIFYKNHFDIPEAN